MSHEREGSIWIEEDFDVIRARWAARRAGRSPLEKAREEAEMGCVSLAVDHLKAAPDISKKTKLEILALAYTRQASQLRKRADTFHSFSLWKDFQDKAEESSRRARVLMRLAQGEDLPELPAFVPEPKQEQVEAAKRVAERTGQTPLELAREDAGKGRVLHAMSFLEAAGPEVPKKTKLEILALAYEGLAAKEEKSAKKSRNLPPQMEMYKAKAKASRRHAKELRQLAEKDEVAKLLSEIGRGNLF